jgi:hypothetical protein
MNERLLQLFLKVSAISEHRNLLMNDGKTETQVLCNLFNETLKY